MSKGRAVEKKSRGRNLKGLSIFDDEIAAPADYGDFMRVDAPIALRESSDVSIAREQVKAPVWEQFLDSAEPVKTEIKNEEPKPIEAKVSKDIEPILEAVSLEPTVIDIKLLNVNGSLKSTEQSTSQIESNVEAAEAIELLELNEVSNLPVTSAEETAHKLPTELEITRFDTPSVSKQLAKPIKEIRDFQIQGFGSLVGAQRKIVIFVFDDCIRAGKSETSPLSTEHICKSLEMTYKTVRGSVWRLQQKGFLEVAASKEGRGGWVIYSLNRDLYNELLLMKNGGVTERTSIQSSQIINKTEIKSENQPLNSSLEDELSSYDISPLLDIRFGKHHLRQLVTQKEHKLSKEEIQDSINYFAFDLKNNNKRLEISGDPINYFMGILRKGIPYTPPTNYITEAEQARKIALAFKIKKIQEQQDDEKKLIEVSFHDWKKTADLKEALMLAPETARNRQGPMLDAYLFEYFEKNVWKNSSNSSLFLGNQHQDVARQISESLTSV